MVLEPQGHGTCTGNFWRGPQERWQVTMQGTHVRASDCSSSQEAEVGGDPQGHPQWPKDLLRPHPQRLCHLPIVPPEDQVSALWFWVGC